MCAVGLELWLVLGKLSDILAYSKVFRGTCSNVSMQVALLISELGALVSRIRCNDGR